MILGLSRYQCVDSQQADLPVSAFYGLEVDCDEQTEVDPDAFDPDVGKGSVQRSIRFIDLITESAQLLVGRTDLD